MSTRTFTKKRPAHDDNGRSAKFAKRDGPGNKPSYQKPYKPYDKANKPFDKGKGKGKTYEKEEAHAKRKRPVTAGGGEVDVDADEDEEMAYEEVEQDAEINNGDGNETGEGEKRPRMTKAERSALHAAQPHRTALLPSHPLLHDTLLPLWEVARRADLGKEERKKAVTELYEAAKGRVLEISKGHKGGRVLQTIVKYGNKEERTGVAMELQPQWRSMMESKYSKFLMGKLIRYCPSIRPLLIPALAPHLTSLLFHADASTPLSDFFDLWATSKERKLLVRGFYPKEVQIFDGQGVGAKGKNAGASAGEDVKNLEGILQDMGDGKGRERVLDGIEKTVVDVFNATQKTALAQGIFHRLVAEYLDCVYKFLEPEAADKKMHELLTAALESLPDIVHTKDGSYVVRQLIVKSGAKDRKQILQHLRKHIEAMSKDADAQMVLFTAFDCVDDTKLMGKAFVADIVALGPDLAFDKNGRRALLYLLTPTSTKHYIPDALKSLAASAQAAREAGTSKKDPETRRKELRSYASEGLLKLVEDKGEEMVREPAAGLVVQEIMLYCDGDKSGAIQGLVAPLETPYPSEDPDSPHILDLPHAIRTYKTLLSGGHFSFSSKSLTVLDPSLRVNLAEAIWRAITSVAAGGEENVLRVACGEATFVLAELVQAINENQSEIKAEVKRVLGSESALQQIEASVKKGAALLAEKIRAM